MGQHSLDALPLCNRIDREVYVMPERMYRVVLTVKQDYEFFVNARNDEEAVEEACCKELDDGVMINDNYECECETVEVQ